MAGVDREMAVQMRGNGAAPPGRGVLEPADLLVRELGRTHHEARADPRAEALGLAVAANLPVLLWGEPGIGKTAVLGQLAEGFGLPMETVVASVHEPSDFAGLPVVGPDAGTAGVAMAPPDWAVRLAGAGAGLVFLDELSSAPPAVQAALLRVVLERRVGSLQLPEGVRVVAAANPPSSAADGWNLTAPLANRFVHLQWRHDPRVVTRGLAGTWPLVPAPAVDPGRVSTSVVRARGVVSGFLSARPGLVHRMPEEPDDRGGAWPSPRTWEMAVRLLALAWAAGADREAVAAALASAAATASRSVTGRPSSCAPSSTSWTCPTRTGCWPTRTPSTCPAGATSSWRSSPP
jgi:hypothetical protein